MLGCELYSKMGGVNTDFFSKQMNFYLHPPSINKQEFMFQLCPEAHLNLFFSYSWNQSLEYFLFYFEFSTIAKFE